MRTLEDINADIEKTERDYYAKWNDAGNTSRSWEEFSKWADPEIKKLAELSREIRMICPYELHEIPDYADVFSLNDFIDCCNAGGFIDYDGFGYYCLNGKETDITIKPSDIKHGAIRREFDSVAWYNR